MVGATLEMTCLGMCLLTWNLYELHVKPVEIPISKRKQRATALESSLTVALGLFFVLNVPCALLHSVLSSVFVLFESWIGNHFGCRDKATNSSIAEQGRTIISRVKMWLQMSKLWPYCIAATMLFLVSETVLSTSHFSQEEPC